MAEGLTGFTHLFNAMRPLESREPGPIAAALERRRAWYGLIVDGVHVDPAMLRLALRGARAADAGHRRDAAGRRRRDTFALYGKRSRSRDGRCTAGRPPRRLGPRHGDAVRNCVRLLDCRCRALRLACARRRPFSGLDDRLGRLARVTAPTSWLDPDGVTVHGVWTAGAKWRPEWRSSGARAGEPGFRESPK